MASSELAPTFRTYSWGFVIGAAGPLLLAIEAQIELHEYVAAARAQGEYVCGLPALVPLALFFVVTPVCGLFGALFAPVIAWLATDFWSEFLNDAREP